MGDGSIGDVIARLLTDIVLLLREDAQKDTIDLDHMTVVAGSGRRSLMKPDWPIAGGKRVIITNWGFGRTDTLAAGVMLKILEGNEGRIGGRIVNKGANGVTLYLGSPEDWGDGTHPAARPVIWLPPPPGPCFWDLMMGKAVYGGPVLAIADTGGSSATTAEV